MVGGFLTSLPCHSGAVKKLCFLLDTWTLVSILNFLSQIPIIYNLMHMIKWKTDRTVSYVCMPAGPWQFWILETTAVSCLLTPTQSGNTVPHTVYRWHLLSLFPQKPSLVSRVFPITLRETSSLTLRSECHCVSQMMYTTSLFFSAAFRSIC